MTALKNTITDLWNGNLSLIDQCGAKDPEVQNLIRLMEKNYGKLEPTLNDTQKKTFTNYINCTEEYICLILEHAFCIGFSTGCRLLSEALTDTD